MAGKRDRCGHHAVGCPGEYQLIARARKLRKAVRTRGPGWCDRNGRLARSVRPDTPQPYFPALGRRLQPADQRAAVIEQKCLDAT